MISKSIKYTFLVLIVLGLLVPSYLAVRERLERATGAATAIDEITDGKTINFSVAGAGGAGATSSPYTVTVALGAEGYRTGSFQFENMANVTVDVHGSNDSNASSTDQFSTGYGGANASSTRTFLDVSDDLIGAANFTANRFVFLDTPVIMRWIRFVMTTSTNALSTVRIKYVRSSK